MDNTYYISGIIFGIVFALTAAFIGYIIRRKVHHNTFKYDERQTSAQGKAFKVGFYTTLITSLGVSIWEHIGTLPGEAFLWHVGALFIGILVYVLTAIHLDAYVGIYDKPERFIRMGFLFCIAMAMSGYANLAGGQPEGKVIAVINLFIVIMWVSIVAALMIRKAKTKAEEDEE